LKIILVFVDVGSWRDWNGVRRAEARGLWGNHKVKACLTA